MSNYKQADLGAAATLKGDYDYTDKANWVKLESGKKGFKSNLLFICPPHVNMKSWFEPAWVHFLPIAGGKVRTIGCPRKMFGEEKECPVCEVAQHMFDTQGKEEARSFWPKPNFMMNVFKVEKDGTITDQVPYVLGCGNELFGLIWDEFGPDESGGLTKDLTDVKAGFILNIKAHETEKRFRGKNVNEYKVQTVGDANGFPGDLELLDTMADLSTFTTYLEPEAVVALLTGGVNADPWADTAEQLTPGAPIEGQYRDVTEEKPKSLIPEDEGDEPTEPLAETEAAAVEAGVRRIAQNAVKRNGGSHPGVKTDPAVTTPPSAAPPTANSTAADLQKFLRDRAAQRK